MDPTQQSFRTKVMSHSKINNNNNRGSNSSTSTSANSNHPHHHRNPYSNSIRHQPESTFKNALKGVRVPAALQEGVHVLRVYANGKTQKSFLTLSEDKFTLYLTTERKSKSRTSFFSSFFGGGGSNNNNNNNSVSSSSTTTNTIGGGGGNVKERAIDIGAIDRIQRGNATKRFELARKNRQDSLKALLSNGAATTTTDPSNNNNNNKVAVDDETSEAGGGALTSSQCFSILFRGDWTLDLMMLNNQKHKHHNHDARGDDAVGDAGDAKQRDEVLDALDLILRTYKQQKQRVSNDVLLLRYHWLDAVSDKDKSQHINSSELQKLLAKMNYLLKPKDLNDVYEKFSRAIGLDRKLRRQGLTFEQTCTLLHKLKRDSWFVKPINVYWNTLFGEFMKNGKPRMNVSDKTFLEKFCHQTQGETSTTLQDVQRLFQRLNDLELPHIAGESQEKDPTRIDKNRFEAYLLMDENDAFDPARQPYQPHTMNRPISEYWINSSHNTYLTGDQFTSHSSVEMYSNALYRGCRCLELDIWDGDLGEDGQPRAVVWHGRTMTSKIQFLDIIKALKLFLNFHPDTFPIILSFENHCSIPYQEAMAEQLVQILGKSLYIPKDESLLLGRLPTPLDLRGMVVIKGRRPNTVNYDEFFWDDDASDDGAPSTIYLGDNQVPPPTDTVHHSICPALARLTLLHGSKLKDWESSIMDPTHHMHSFSENKVRSLAKKTDRHQWTIYNQSHMSRTYPAGSRIDSSNYMPILPWSLGCQLVSLNFQTTDTPLLLNDGRFRENGGCGYVLKSDSVLQLQTPSRDPHKPMKLSIRILSGSCLPKPKPADNKCIDPYVRVSVFDVKSGYKEDVSTFSTGVIYNNGFFPIWNEVKFNFVVESWPSAMLQLTIFDKEVAPSADEFVATAAIPISCLRQGLRCVKLNDATNLRSGAMDFASLLVEVTKTWGDATDLAKRDSFGGSAHNKPDILQLTRSRTDNSKGSNNKGTSKPTRLERARTENTVETVPASPRRGSSGPRLEKTKLVRARTDQSKGEASLSSLAEF